MQLNFEYTIDLGVGEVVAVNHFFDNSLHVFFLDANKNLCVYKAVPELGLYDVMETSDTVICLPDALVDEATVAALSFSNLYGGFIENGSFVLASYDMTKCLFTPIITSKSIYVKVNGAYQMIDSGYVKSSGTYVPLDQFYTKIQGAYISST